PSTASAQDELHLLAADEVLVSILDLAALDALLVEPGSVRGAEVLDVEAVGLLRDHRVLAGDLAGVDDEVAVLAAADDEEILRDGLGVSALGHQIEKPLAFGGVVVAFVERGRVVGGLVVVAVVFLGGQSGIGLCAEVVGVVKGGLGVLARATLDEALQLGGGL